MEAVHIIIVIIILYFIYDMTRTSNKQLNSKLNSKYDTKNNTDVNYAVKSNSDRQQEIVGSLNQLRSKRFIQDESNDGNDHQSNEIKHRQRMSSSQYKPSSMIVPNTLPTSYDSYMDSNINPYTGELSDIPLLQSTGASYDIMDRDILAKTGRDTIQGLYIHKAGTNEILWRSGGSINQ
jgi:hypothetical protein